MRRFREYWGMVVRNRPDIRGMEHELQELRRQLMERDRELTEALQSAAHIQRSLVPSSPPTYHNLHFAWISLPFKQVGGDLFNVTALDEGTIMLYLIDVSGHGLASAMISVAVHQTLSPTTGKLLKQPLGYRPYYRITPPSEVLAGLDAEYPFERFEEFFTISYLLLNPHSGRVRYANAGHPPPLLLRSDGTLERLDEGGPVIGLGQRDGNDGGEVQLQEGDRLFLYTDGLIDQTGERGTAYGEGRFVEQLYGERGNGLEDTCRKALAAQRAFAGETPPQDDVTLIAIEFSRREPAGLAT